MNTKKELAERASDVLKQLKELDTLLGGETWRIRSQIKDAMFYTTGLRNNLEKDASMEKPLDPVPEAAFAELDRLVCTHPVSCWLLEEGAPNWYFAHQDECGFTAGWLYSLLEDLKELNNFKILAGILAERDRLGKSEVNWYHELQSRVKEPSDEALRQWLESGYAVEPEDYIDVTRQSGDAEAWAYRCMCSALVTTLIKRMKNGGTHE